MLATYSPETLIAQGLEDLGCAGNNFAEISGVMSRSRLAQGLTGQKEFEHHDAQKMLLTLEEMRELRDFLQTPPDWKQTEAIRAALEQRRQVRKMVKEVNDLFSAYMTLERN
jgi:hypothetical protein